MNAHHVVGNGLIATAIAKSSVDPLRACFFASGVSNSACTEPEAFDREKHLLMQTIEALDEPEKLIYFSTCSVYDSQLGRTSMYVQHKLRMESLVAQRGNYLTIRLPQIVGISKNKFTLTNYIRDCILEAQPMQIQTKAKRNLIDVDDMCKLVFGIASDIRYQNSIVNVANPMGIRVTDIVLIMEKILNKPALCHFKDEGSSYEIDTSIVHSMASRMQIHFNDNYVENVLIKYYSAQ